MHMLDAVPYIAKPERVRACGSVPADVYATMAFEERP
jgi:hypothetical protein